MTGNSGIQVILRICLRNLRGCNVDVTNGIDSDGKVYVTSFVKGSVGVQAILRFPSEIREAVKRNL
jgi:hypothetical protein